MSIWGRPESAEASAASPSSSGESVRKSDRVGSAWAEKKRRGRAGETQMPTKRMGEDCHVISNTGWLQPSGNNEHLGRFWHIDAGPHVPRDPDIPWDPRIPYPIFAIAAHIFLRDCPLEAGPTAVIPRSHTSGQPPPFDQLADGDLEWNGRQAIPLVAEAGDVALFVSDIWHSRLPPAGEGDKAEQTAGRRMSRVGQDRDRQVLGSLGVETMRLAPECHADMGVGSTAHPGFGLLVDGQVCRLAL